MCLDTAMILDETSRASAREELVIMAIDIRFMREELVSKLEEVKRLRKDAIARGSFLGDFWYRTRARSISRRADELLSLYERVMKLALMTHYAPLADLRSELRALRISTRPDVCLNTPRLPWSIRSRIDEASVHLM